MRPLFTAILALAILEGGTVLSAQTASGNRPRRRWEISYTLGNTRGGETRAIWRAMVADGHNSTTPAGCYFFGCSGAVAHPETYAGGLTNMFAVSYAVRPGLGVRLQHNGAELGEIIGHHAPSGWLFLRQSVTSTSVLAVVSSGGLHAGLGPAIHRPAIIREGATQQTSSTGTKIGLTAQASLTLPAHTRVFADLAIHYQLVGSMAFGPFTTSDSSATLSRMRASFNYHTIRVGMGVRI